MKRPVPLVLAVLAGLLATVLVVRELAQPPEPVYLGKSVTAWIQELSLQSGSLGCRVSIGTKANPIRLLRSSGTNPPPYSLAALLSRTGVTNVFVFDDEVSPERAVQWVACIGAFDGTNKICIGSQTNLARLASLARSRLDIRVLGIMALQASVRGAPSNSITVPLFANIATSPMTVSSLFIPVSTFIPAPFKAAPGLNPIYVSLDSPRGYDQAMEALQAIRAPAVPYLARALRQRDGPFRRVHLKLYAFFASARLRFVPTPSVDAAFTRSAAAGALLQMVDLAGPAAPELIAALSDPDPAMRHIALRILDGLSSKSPRCLRAVGQFLGRMSHTEVIKLVVGQKLHGPAAVEALAAGLSAPGVDLGSRRNAVLELRWIGPSAKAVTPALIKALQDPDLYIRCRACEILGELKADPDQVLPALTAALDSPESSLRANAAEALGAYRAEARSALPKLLALRNSTNRLEFDLVQKALQQIAPEAAVEAGTE